MNPPAWLELLKQRYLLDKCMQIFVFWCWYQIHSVSSTITQLIHLRRKRICCRFPNEWRSIRILYYERFAKNVGNSMPIGSLNPTHFVPIGVECSTFLSGEIILGRKNWLTPPCWNVFRLIDKCQCVSRWRNKFCFNLTKKFVTLALISFRKLRVCFEFQRKARKQLKIPSKLLKSLES